MAKGVNRTILDAATPDHQLSEGLAGGRVKCIVDTYEANSLAQNSIIYMGAKLPLGAVVVDVVVDTDALGGSTTIDVGDAEDPDRYIDGADTSSAGTHRAGNGKAAEDAVPYTVDATDETDRNDSANSDRQVQITLLGAAGTGSIRCMVYFIKD